MVRVDEGVAGVTRSPVIRRQRQQQDVLQHSQVFFTQHASVLQLQVHFLALMGPPCVTQLCQRALLIDSPSILY